MGEMMRTSPGATAVSGNSVEGLIVSVLVVTTGDGNEIIGDGELVSGSAARCAEGL